MKSWSGDWNLPSIDIRCLEVLVRNSISVMRSVLELFFEAVRFVL